MALAAPLETELQVFEEHRREWSLGHLGEYVVIQDGHVLDQFFDAYEDAFRAGLREFGVSRNFLVKQIWIIEPVYFVAWYDPVRGTLGSVRSR